MRLYFNSTKLILALGLFATCAAAADTPAPSKIVFLGDLSPSTVEVFRDGTWGFAGKGILGRSDSAKISVNGVDSPNGLNTVPPSNGRSRLVFQLAKKYERFLGDAALNDTVERSRTPLVFRVVADNKTIWTSRPVQLSKQKQSFDVDVKGVDTLELIVNCPGDLHDAHAVWVEPRLYAIAESNIGSNVTTPGKPSTPAIPDVSAPAETNNRPQSLIKNQATIKSMMVRVANDGQMIGAVTDLIATVAPDGQPRGVGDARFVGDVGADMSISLSESLRAIRLKYPRWDGGIVELSFGERYDKHDGGSAGAAFGVLLLSILEGVELDPAVAISGDLTVDSKVRKVGGVAAKVRGAQLDKVSLALIPAENGDAISDMVLLYDESLLWDVHVFSIATLQDALGLARKSRDKKYVEAMSLFSELRAKRGSGARSSIPAAELRASLSKIAELAPNSLSARQLLAISKGEAPKSLSAAASLYQFSIAAYPYRDLLFQGGNIERGAIPTGTAATARKRMNQLRPIADRSILPLLKDFSDFVDSADRAAVGAGNPTDLATRRQALLGKLQDLQASRDVMEKLVREGI